MRGFSYAIRFTSDVFSLDDLLACAGRVTSRVHPKKNAPSSEGAFVLSWICGCETYAALA